MYYICYTHPLFGDVWETIDGEDAMQQRVDELCNMFQLDSDDVHVFNQDNEI